MYVDCNICVRDVTNEVIEIDEPNPRYMDINMKTPDACGSAIEEVIETEWDDIDQSRYDDYEHYVDERVAELNKVCEKWFKYGECLTVRIDLASETIEVI